MPKSFKTPKSNFTIVPNEILYDRSLSLRERGLWVTLASFSDRWKFSVNGIVTLVPDGKDAVNTAVKSLEEKGYITRPEQRRVSGKYAPSKWILNCPPRNSHTVTNDNNTFPTVFSSTGNPVAGNPVAASPISDKPMEENTAESITSREITEDKEIQTTTNDNYSDVVDLLKPFNLNEKTIDVIYRQASGDIEPIRNAVSMILSARKNPINNVAGFIIDCIKKGYVQTPYTPKQVNEFNNFEQRNYTSQEIDEIVGSN